MGFQLKLLGFWVFILLTLSFCHGKNVTVKVIGLIHCTDCVRHEFSSSQASLGINVFIRCKSKNREMKTQGNGAVDREGKFNVTLSAEITKDGNSMEGCFAKLQSASAAPCPIQNAQTASLKLLSTEDNATLAAHNRLTLIKFSPVTCQSAFFWPQPNFTFFPTSPPPPGQAMVYAPPPSQGLPTLAPPVQPPLPPVENPPPAPASAPSYLPSIPSLPPTVPPPAPEFGNPSPLPDLNFRPPPTPAPTFQSPQKQPNPTFKSPSPPPIPIYNTPPLPPQVPPTFNEPVPSPTPKFPKPIPPPFSKQLPTPPPYSNQLPPPPTPFHQTPFTTPTPILPPIPPPHQEPRSKTPNAPSIPLLKPPTPFAENPYPSLPLPKLEKPIPPPSPIAISTPPNQRKPNPIPRAPPVPQLPPIPTVPRKYFNSPKSKSKPPHSSYSSHS